MYESKLERKLRLDNFDYDEISLGSDNNSPQLEMALLSHTLLYPTDENLKDDVACTSTKDNYTSDFSSSNSIFPRKIPIGLCNNFVSEDTISQTCLSSSLINDFSDENLNINTDERAKLVEALDNHNNNTMNFHHFESLIKPNKTLSSFLLESAFYENLQIVSSAPVLSPVQENNLLHELKINQNKRRSSCKPPRENSVSKYLNHNSLRASGCSSMLEPNSLRSQEFNSEDWLNGNWRGPKSDTLLKFDDLSTRDSEVSNLEESINLYLDVHQDQLEWETRVQNKWRRCQILIMSLCCLSAALLSLICILAAVIE